MTDARPLAPFGFVCPCGAEHRYDSWALAHMREVLTHKCPACGREAVILRGVARGATGRLEPITQPKEQS